MPDDSVIGVGLVDRPATRPPKTSTQKRAADDGTQMGDRHGPATVTASTAVKLLPLIEDAIHRLKGTGRFRTRMQAWTNRAYDQTTRHMDGAPGDAAINVQPPAELNLMEEMFPSSSSMLRRMSLQFGAVVALIVAHIFLTTYTDPILLNSPLTQVIVYGGQGGLLLAIVGSFFVMTSQTLYIRLGRYDLYLREFAILYGMFLLEVLLFVAMKAYAVVLQYRRISYLALWDAPGYTALWVVQRVALLGFWCAALYNSLAVFDVRYFDPDLLMSRQKKKSTQQQQQQLVLAQQLRWREGVGGTPAAAGGST